ncbi:MAG: addiction module protein [Phycisphaerales bacterium]|nr:addiction module protein [Phycisphaerales bacterium]
MTRSLDDIDYLRLSPAERLLLVQDILDSVMAEAQAEPLTPEQIAELDRRCAEIDSGVVSCLPWEDIRARFLGSE